MKTVTTLLLLVATVLAGCFGGSDCASKITVDAGTVIVSMTSLTVDGVSCAPRPSAVTRAQTSTAAAHPEAEKNVGMRARMQTARQRHA